MQSHRVLRIVAALVAVALVSVVAEPVRAAASEPPAGWLDQVSQDIRHSEYRFSLQHDGSLAAPNRAHNLRSTLGKEGLLVVPRTAPDEEPAWWLALTVTGYGRDGALEPEETLLPESDGTRVELRREHLTEWYVNDERGIEQGFDLPHPPDEASSKLPVVIEIAIQGSVGAHPSEDGRAILFKTASGAAVLRYAELLVVDALGDPVEASLAVLPGRLQIRIDDRSARYPLHVDPLLTSPAWTVESDQGGGRLGYAVAAAGDVNGDGFGDVIVGAAYYDNGQTDEGRVYVFLGSASGLSTTPAWTAESDQDSALFGFIVASAGDVNGDGYGDVIVGAPHYTGGVYALEGTAFVWHGSAAGLGSNGTPGNADWRASSLQPGGLLGVAVAAAGDVNGDGFGDVIVGAYGGDDGQIDEGVAAVWLGSASGLGSDGNLGNADWRLESDQAGAHLGIAVGTAGDVNGDGYADVIVGADAYALGAGAGAAFVWYGSASGPSWPSSNPDWKAESPRCGGGGSYGVWVGTAGDVNGDGFSDVMVGADAHGGCELVGGILIGTGGAAFVWHGSASGLGPDGTPANADWSAADDQADGGFAYSVASAGDVNGDGFADVTVGAFAWPTFFAVGRAFAWFGGPSGLGASGTPANADWAYEAQQGTEVFGWALGPAGDVNGDGFGDVIVGAYGYTNGQTDEGRAYVFLGAGDKPLLTPGWIVSGAAGSLLFVDPRSAGDVNGDGYSDVIVGAPFADNGETDEGRVYLYLGSSSGPAASPSWTAEGNSASVRFGSSVASAGDVNGDGYADVIVGAPFASNGEVWEGRAYLYLGAAMGLGSIAAWTAEGNQAGAQFGHAVASAGDVNGDGYGDVIVGAPFYDNGQDDQGRAYVYLGSASGLAPAAGWITEGGQDGTQYGHAVASAGDYNGDGFGDVIVGAPLHDGLEIDDGAAFLYRGSPGGLVSGGEFLLGDTFYLGISVAAGDLNGDGYTDVIAGEEGFVLSWAGSPAGLATQWSVAGGSSFGGAVASTGDLNGDGYGDLLIGERYHSNGQTNEGAAYVYLGSASGVVTPAAWKVEGNTSDAELGTSVASAGDVNGDGFADLLVAVHNDPTTPRAALYYGNTLYAPVSSEGFALPPLDRAARQVRADGTAPIAFLGRSDSEAVFRLRALGRTAAGRGRVKLEWEVKPIGTSFDGAGLARGASFKDTGFPDAAGSAVALEEAVSGLSQATTYHWRARIVADDPAFPHSPWLTLPYNGRNEADFRTPASAPPSVVAVVPPNYSEGNSRATNVVVTFSEAVAPASVTPTSFRLKAPGNISVPASVSVAGTQATLDPTSALVPETLYTVEVTTGVLDLAGNALPSTFTSSFRTAAAPSSEGTPLPVVSDPSTPPPAPALARTGAAVAAAGDLNGDGIRDFLSGAPGYQVGANAEAGAALVYLGSTSATERATPDIIFTGEAAHDRVGVAVAGDFDFNLDGRGDILIGAEQVDRTGTPTATGAGKVYLIHFDPADYPNLGNPSVPDVVSLSQVGATIPGVVFTGVSPGDQAGFSVAGKGRPSEPVQPPGPCMLLIGVPGFDAPPGPCTNAGKVYAIFSDPALSGSVSLSRVANGAGDEVAGISFEDPPNPCDSGALLGYAVGFPGDVTGAPGEDLAFSAPYADTVVDSVAQVDAGIVYLVQGGALSTETVSVDEIGVTRAGTQILGDRAGALLGYSLAGGGDFQADGMDDLLLGAPLYPRTLPLGLVEAQVGAVFQSTATFGKGIIEVCLLGSSMDGTTYLGETSGDQLGYAVAGVGDVNGDGYDDIALGAPYTDPSTTTDAGTTYLLLGGSYPRLGGIIEVCFVGATLAGAQLTGTEDGEHAGSSLAGTGDLNDGGTDDFVVGAPDKNSGSDTDAGTVYQVILDDFDADGTLDGADCAPTDAALWSTSGEAIDVVLVDRNTLSWAEPLERGGVPGTLHYDTLRSTSPSDFTSAAATCIETDGSDTTTTDTATPAAGARFAYLVVATNGCGQGDPGAASSGQPRAVRSCP